MSQVMWGNFSNCTQMGDHNTVHGLDDSKVMSSANMLINHKNIDMYASNI